MTHTPAPWTVGELDRNEQRQVVAGSLVATCAHECVTSRLPAMEANARLIAASPDMLESLEYVVKLAYEALCYWDSDNDMKVGKILKALSGHLRGYTKEIDAVHAAIAKAKATQPMRATSGTRL